MRRPCWHFLQAGHCLTSSIRTPFPRTGAPPLSALHPRPRIPGPEHLRKVVHAIEVLRLVARLPREQADVDQGEHHASQVLGARDPPVPEDSEGEQAELIARE